MIQNSGGGLIARPKERSGEMKVYLDDRHGKEVEGYTFDDFEPDKDGNALPTSRLLSCDPEDSWAAEEWKEHGTIKGLPCTVYYLFDQDDLNDAKEHCPDDPYEALPWGEEHVARVIIHTEE